MKTGLQSTLMLEGEYDEQKPYATDRSTPPSYLNQQKVHAGQGPSAPRANESKSNTSIRARTGDLEREKAMKSC